MNRVDKKVRLPVGLAKKLNDYAKSNGLSENAVVNLAIAEKLKREKRNG